MGKLGKNYGGMTHVSIKKLGFDWVFNWVFIRQ